MTFATMTTRASLRAPKSMLLHIFQIFITFVHILCFSVTASPGLRAQLGPQITSALGPGMYLIIIIQTVFLIVPLFAVERTTSLLQSDWRCCFAVVSPSTNSTPSYMHGGNSSKRG